MTWRVVSRVDPERWLESTGGVEFTADFDTTVALADLVSYSYELTPTGPTQVGVTTPSELFGAAWGLIPSPRALGNYPDYPPYPSDPDVVY